MVELQDNVRKSLLAHLRLVARAETVMNSLPTIVRGIGKRVLCDVCSVAMSQWEHDSSIHVRTINVFSIARRIKRITVSSEVGTVAPICAHSFDFLRIAWRQA